VRRAGQHQTVDDGTSLGSIHGVAEQPAIAFEKVVVDRHPAVFGVARQIFPSFQSVGYGIAKLAVRQDPGGDFIKPFLEGVQDGDAVLLAEAANALIWRFASVRFFVPRLPFNPVELFEESERLLRRPAAPLRLEGIDKAPSRVGHASNMGCPFQRAPAE